MNNCKYIFSQNYFQDIQRCQIISNTAFVSRLRLTSANRAASTEPKNYFKSKSFFHFLYDCSLPHMSTKLLVVIGIIGRHHFILFASIGKISFIHFHHIPFLRFKRKSPLFIRHCLDACSVLGRPKNEIIGVSVLELTY